MPDHELLNDWALIMALHGRCFRPPPPPHSLARRRHRASGAAEIAGPSEAPMRAILDRILATIIEIRAQIRQRSRRPRS